MLALAIIATLVQATVMLVDEGWFHRRRGLPRWERLGHPIDTLGIAICYAFLILVRPDGHALAIFGGLAVASCLLVTKDEWVHARRCSPGEHWLHSILFVLHPIVLASAGAIWWLRRDAWFLTGQLVLALAFMTYQLVYWSLLWNRRPLSGR